MKKVSVFCFFFWPTENENENFDIINMLLVVVPAFIHSFIQSKKWLTTITHLYRPHNGLLLLKKREKILYAVVVITVEIVFPWPKMICDFSLSLSHYYSFSLNEEREKILNLKIIIISLASFEWENNEWNEKKFMANVHIGHI